MKIEDLCLALNIKFIDIPVKSPRKKVEEEETEEEEDGRGRRDGRGRSAILSWRPHVEAIDVVACILCDN